VAALAELDRDYHNIRAALHWSIDAGEHELAARIVASLLTYWDMRGLIREGRFWSEQVLRLGKAVPRPLRVRVRANAGMLAFRQRRPNEVADLAAASLADSETPLEIASAANLAGLAAMESGDMASARRHFEALLMLARQHELLPWIARTELHLGLLALAQGQLDEAEALLWGSYTTAEQIQHPPLLGLRLIALGYIAALRGDLQQAESLMHDGLKQLLVVPETTILLYAVLAYAALAALQQQPLRAAKLFGAAIQHGQNVGVAIGGPVRNLVQRQIEQARDQIDDTSFERALERGRLLSLAEALTLAQSLAPSIEQEVAAMAA
jgi:hypothetical protein